MKKEKLLVCFLGLFLICWVVAWGYIIFNDKKNKTPEKPVEIQTITSRHSEVVIEKLKVNQTQKAKCDVVDIPEDITPTCTYTISNPEIANVTDEGNILGVKGGRTFLKTSLSEETVEELRQKNYKLCDDCIDSYSIIIVQSVESNLSLVGDANYKGIKPTLAEGESILSGDLGSSSEVSDWLNSQEPYTFRIKYAIDSEEKYTIDKIKISITNINHEASLTLVEQLDNEYTYEVSFKAGSSIAGTQNVDIFYLRETTGFSIIDFILPDGSTNSLVLWQHQKN